MDKLSESSLIRIFQYLGPKDWLQLSQVCLQWKEISEKVWKDSAEIFVELEPDMCNSYATISEDEVFSIIQFYGNLFKNVKLRPFNMTFHFNTDLLYSPIKFGNHTYMLALESEETVEQIYQQISTVCYNITHLYLSESVDIDFVQLIQLTTGLKSFWCSSELIIDFDVCKYLPESLEELAISPEKLNKQSFTTFMKKHTALKKFELNYCSEKGDNFALNEVIEILSMYAPELESVSLAEYAEVEELDDEISLASFILLSNFVNLKELHLYGYFTLSREMCIILQNCENLTDLTIRYFGFYQRDLEELMKIPTLQVLKTGVYDYVREPNSSAFIPATS